jgi:hypothetical protein
MIRPTVVKNLWGRAGGRCSICRIELTSVEGEGVLGEMAHIDARSADGPRANPDLDADTLDSYENLMLLCPNDHTTVDRAVEQWPVERLREVKREHELWIALRLSEGSALPFVLDTSAHRQERRSYWKGLDRHSWLCCSLTPLALSQDVIDPLGASYRRLISVLDLPQFVKIYLNPHPNPTLTEPNSNGLVNEDFRRLREGVGYRVEIFRNGYVEFVTCIDELLGRFPVAEMEPGRAVRRTRISDHRLMRCRRLLPYFPFADSLTAQVKALLRVWRDGTLPFRDMVLSTFVIGAQGTCILRPGQSDEVVGRPLEGDEVGYEAATERDVDTQELLGVVLRRLANAFGLELDPAFTAAGELVAPSYLAVS